MASKPKEPIQGSRPVQVYLDWDEQQMLEELRAADVRNISDTLRYALRQTHTARFGKRIHSVPQAQQ